MEIRDNFVNTLLKDLGIKILRINNCNFNEEKLEESIKINCTDKEYAEN